MEVDPAEYLEKVLPEEALVPVLLEEARALEQEECPTEYLEVLLGVDKEETLGAGKVDCPELLETKQEALLIADQTAWPIFSVMCQKEVQVTEKADCPVFSGVVLQEALLIPSQTAWPASSVLEQAVFPLLPRTGLVEFLEAVLEEVRAMEKVDRPVLSATR
ncbi:MAG: uncharacterized protein A8A55_2386 [Amphiamblys sp. WSBS2006]|nr:MAG: uncharacterized protein A8A55_2386 [Amphiamblys sp. WSBS2006]